ncbi:MAG: hypothetical protein INF55_17345 [Roseomonas sp.]|nr:hypothetical protein [Roseomonas sp.]
MNAITHCNAVKTAFGESSGNSEEGISITSIADMKCNSCPPPTDLLGRCRPGGELAFWESARREKTIKITSITRRTYNPWNSIVQHCRNTHLNALLDQTLKDASWGT